jgi:hypothetical protein
MDNPEIVATLGAQDSGRLFSGFTFHAGLGLYISLFLFLLLHNL